MKKVFGIAALLLAFVACNKVETEITPVEQPSDSKGITITATLAPKTADTKAVADKGDNKITVTWAKNEHIGILYEVDDTKYSADAEIISVDDEGTATIEFTVESGTPDNTACTLVYPYSAAKDDNSGVKDAATLLSAQDGTLNANLDVRVGAGTIRTTTPGLDVTTQPAAQFAIFKFTLSGPSIDATHPLVIKDNASNKTITTVTPASTATSVFVAMPAAASTTYKFVVITADNKYIKSGTATIEAGKYYQTTLTMSPRYPLALSSATTDDLGALLASDGNIYETGAAATAASTTAIGVIAYIGTDNYTENGSIVGGLTFVGHGLVMCLKNAASSVKWSTNSHNNEFGEDANVWGDATLKRTENVSGYMNTKTLAEKTDAATTYPAAYQAKNYTGLTAPATGTTGWFLPSAQQWVKMIEGLGGLADGAPSWGLWFDRSHTAVDKWEAALAKAGSGNYDSMIPYLGYWSSSEYSFDYAVVLDVDARDTGGNHGFGWFAAYKDYNHHVRPVLAFGEEGVPAKLLSAATTSDVGKVVCAAGHLHEAKTAVPASCTAAVGILGKVTSTGHGLILALQDATAQTWNTIHEWDYEETYATYTTLQVLPDDAARGANLTSYTALGSTAVSNWAVASMNDYKDIFTNLGSKQSDSIGTTYDGNVHAYITTGVGGTALSGSYWSATGKDGDNGWAFNHVFWGYSVKSDSYSVRPVLGF